MYKKEAKQEEKIEKMQGADDENYAFKEQAKGSRMLIPDCQCRLEAAYTNLLHILENENVGRS